VKKSILAAIGVGIGTTISEVAINNNLEVSWIRVLVFSCIAFVIATVYFRIKDSTNDVNSKDSAD
jgi:Ni,Fe-hydrogenase I cytochrome b subunit